MDEQASYIGSADAMKARTALRGLALAALLLSSGCEADPGPPDYRYRLTVEVETPEGLKTGSSVIAVEQNMGRSAAGGFNQIIVRHVTGEAVAVDLPGGKTLFALLRSGVNSDWAGSVMQSIAPRVPGQTFEETFDNVLLVKGEVTLPRLRPREPDGARISGYPTLVVFRDIANPTSVAKVDPDDLAATFGQGTSLKRITVQLTDEPVTTGIESRLPWLGSIDTYRTRPDNPFTNTLPNEIGGLRSVPK